MSSIIVIKIKTMKKYNVKIVPQAYILTVEAENEESAKVKAMQKFDAGEYEDDENGGETIIMGAQESRDKRAFDIISDLMDIIEANEPEYYYKSDLIASADDLLKELDGQRDECENKDSNGNACYNCESGFGGACGEAEEEKENQKITVPLSESDLQDLQNGESFDWTFDGVDVHLRLEEEGDNE